MIKNKYKKILIISFCFTFAIISVYSGIMANNMIHIDSCNEHNCLTCEFISLANNFIKEIVLIYFNICILSGLISLIQFMKKNVNGARKLKLVELKVIQNK